MEPRLVHEIEELHEVFGGWFRGDIPEEGFARVERALAPGFRLVSPDGVLRDRKSLLAALRAARGDRPGIRITARPRDSRPLGDDLHLAVYEEWQDRPGERRGRLSSALLHDHPEGWRWLHVHETWLPD